VLAALDEGARCAQTVRRSFLTTLPLLMRTDCVMNWFPIEGLCACTPFWCAASGWAASCSGWGIIPSGFFCCMSNTTQAMVTAESGDFCAGRRRFAAELL
jgi:hypothetical protein